MRTFAVLSSALVSLVLVSSAPVGAQSSPAIKATGDLCTGGTGEGTGLRGAYYSADPYNSSPSLVRVDARIDFATIHNLPERLAAAPQRWVRWCGWIRPIASGPHRFQAGARAARIEVGTLPVAGPTAASEVSVELEAGKIYPILIELPPTAEARGLSLKWTPPFGATYDIPPTVLFPPVETVTPGC